MSFVFPKETDNPFIANEMMSQRESTGYIAGTAFVQEFLRTSLSGALTRFHEQNMYNALDTSTPLSPEEATKRYGIQGHLSFSSPIKESVAKILNQRKTDELSRDEVISRAQGALQSGAVFTAAMASNLFDPTTLLASSVPVLGEANWAKLLARFGTTKGRLIGGAIEGSVGNLALEPLILGQALNDQAEYTAWDSLMNVGMGFVIGGGLSVGIGKFSDWNAQVRQKTHLNSIKTAVNQLKEGKPVEVEPIVRASATEDKTVYNEVSLDEFDQPEVEKIILGGDEPAKELTTSQLTRGDIVELVLDPYTSQPKADQQHVVFLAKVKSSEPGGTVEFDIIGHMINGRAAEGANSLVGKSIPFLHQDKKIGGVTIKEYKDKGGPGPDSTSKYKALDVPVAALNIGDHVDYSISNQNLSGTVIDVETGKYGQVSIENENGGIDVFDVGDSSATFSIKNDEELPAPIETKQLAEDTSPKLGDPNESELQLLMEAKHQDPIEKANLVKEGTQPTISSHPVERVVDQETGKVYYAKYPDNVEHIRSEYIAFMLYKMAGVDVPEVRPIFDNGKLVGLASEDVFQHGTELGVQVIPKSMAETKELIENIHKEAPEHKLHPNLKRFYSGILIDIWLGNRDFAAPGNLVFNDHDIFRIDYGGALEFRAQGEKKADFTESVPELQSFYGQNDYPATQVIWLGDGLGYHTDIDRGINRLAKISDDDILSMVYSTGMSPEDAANLSSILIGRRDIILKHKFQFIDKGAGINEMYTHHKSNNYIKRAMKYAVVISKAAISKLSHYKGSGYIHTNSTLRKYKGKPPEDVLSSKAIALLDEAMSSFTFQNTTYLWRGAVPPQALGLKTTDAGTARSKLLGTGNPFSFFDWGYVSTSVDRDFGLGWGHSDQFVLRIQVPPGQKAGLPGLIVAHKSMAAKDGFITDSHLPDSEYEFVLPRETRMAVTAVYRDKFANKTIVNVKIVPHDNIKPIGSDDLMAAAMKYKMASSLGADDKALPEELSYSLKEAMQVDETENIFQAYNKEADELLNAVKDQPGVSENELKQIAEDYDTMEKQATGMAKGAYAAYTCVMKNANI